MNGMTALSGAVGILLLAVCSLQAANRSATGTLQRARVTHQALRQTCRFRKPYPN